MFFLQHVRLVVANCKEYNIEGSEICLCAERYVGPCLALCISICAMVTSTLSLCQDGGVL